MSEKVSLLDFDSFINTPKTEFTERPYSEQSQNIQAVQVDFVILANPRLRMDLKSGVKGIIDKVQRGNINTLFF